MEYKEFTAKTVEDAITEACQEYTVTSDRLDYEVVEEGSSGFLGIGSKPAIIRARIKGENEVQEIKETVKTEKEEKVEKKAVNTGTKTLEWADDVAEKFLSDVFKAMQMEVEIDIKNDEAERALEINLSGPEMGILIGKRGQTLDSLQYLLSLVVNKDKDNYIKIKLDSENYRERRKETLINLAKNVAYKVKRTKRPVSLEPMNPYERRIIHAALQDDKYVTTYSEGEEPFRRVVVSLRK